MSDPIPSLRPNPILRWFAFAHLPDDLAAVSQWFAELAGRVEAELPGGAEKSTALRYLLISKDAAVRATIEGRDREQG